MKVKYIASRMRQFDNEGNIVDTPDYGDVIDVSEDEGNALVADGRAVKVDKSDAPVVDTKVERNVPTPGEKR